mmetsp:Transcript_11848/g.27324  ORF Transcript_11848/g.27324 Transcript_11848/m.27324 type:complete len:271 (+) Transcript_11848:1009-1821(+)
MPSTSHSAHTLRSSASLLLALLCTSALGLASSSRRRGGERLFWCRLSSSSVTGAFLGCSGTRAGSGSTSDSILLARRMGVDWEVTWLLLGEIGRTGELLSVVVRAAAELFLEMRWDVRPRGLPLLLRRDEKKSWTSSLTVLSCKGTWKTKVVPLPTADSHLMSPPMSSASFLHTLSPRAPSFSSSTSPSTRLVDLESVPKIILSCSVSMPGPSSMTSIVQLKQTRPRLSMNVSESVLASTRMFSIPSWLREWEMILVRTCWMRKGSPTTL